MPRPLWLSNVFLWPSPPPCLSTVLLGYPHRQLSLLPFQGPFLLAGISILGHTFVSGPAAQDMLALRASYRTANHHCLNSHSCAFPAPGSISQGLP